MPKSIGITDVQKAKEAMDRFRIQADKIFMNKQDYEDLLKFEHYPCPECEALCGPDIKHPDNGCSYGKIYNVMEF